jgi:hypothetical protein
MTACRPTATFTADVDSAFQTVFAAQTYQLLSIMFGRTPGSSWCVCIPRAKIAQVPARGIHAEQTATQVNLIACENDSDDASTALMRSPIFISRI